MDPSQFFKQYHMNHWLTWNIKYAKKFLGISFLCAVEMKLKSKIVSSLRKPKGDRCFLVHL